MDIINPLDGFVTAGDKIMSLSEWSKTFSNYDNAQVTKVFSCEFEKAGSDEDRTIKTIISDGGTDRDLDKIDSEGWDVSEYEKNPVVLWAHSHSDLPVAKAQVKVLKSKLVSLDKFPEKGVYPFADTLFDLVKGGFVNAKSVGFIPREFTFDEKRGGFNFAEQVLMEHSYVPVPSNPRALVVARSKGINLDPLVSWAEKTLDEWREEKGVYVPRSVMEEVWKQASDKETVYVDATEYPTTKEACIVSNEDLDTLDIALEGLSEESQEFLQKRISMKKLEEKLYAEGFEEDEVEEILAEVMYLEGDISEKDLEDVIEEVVEEEEEKSGEPVYSVNEDDLLAVIKEAVDEVKAATTELTGKVN